MGWWVGFRAVAVGWLPSSVDAGRGGLGSTSRAKPRLHSSIRASDYTGASLDSQNPTHSGRSDFARIWAFRGGTKGKGKHILDVFLPRAPNLIYHIFVKEVYTLKSIIVHKNKNETNDQKWVYSQLLPKPNLGFGNPSRNR
mgnify:CR=1 FL=1